MTHRTPSPLSLSHPLSLFLLLSACTAPPQTIRASLAPAEPEPSVEVTGTAEVVVVPDEFVIRASVRSFGLEIGAASEDNRQRVAALLKFLAAQGVERRYVATDAMSVTPRVDHSVHQAPKILGYEVEKRVTVILHRADKLEPVLQGLLARGADQLLGVEFHATNIEALKEQARLEATANARSRAAAMAARLGQKLGAPLRISEHPGGHHDGSFVYKVATPEAGESLAVGKIRVPAAVTVRFALRS